jgi:hypothetical protein
MNETVQIYYLLASGSRVLQRANFPLRGKQPKGIYIKLQYVVSEEESFFILNECMNLFKNIHSHY